MTCAIFTCVNGYTFLPYGSAKAPSQIPDAALQVRRESYTRLREELDRCNWQVIAATESDPTLLLLQGDRATDLDSLAEHHGAQCFHIDAGPFSSVEGAAQLMLQWVQDFWECKQLEERNSCFEFGGCHRRCWWRGIGRIRLKLTTAGTSACAEPESGALADLLLRAADTGADDVGEAPALELIGALICFGEDGVYCGLRPKH